MRVQACILRLSGASTHASVGVVPDPAVAVGSFVPSSCDASGAGALLSAFFGGGTLFSAFCGGGVLLSAFFGGGALLSAFFEGDFSEIFWAISLK